jgi:hypothetical protein
MHAGSPLPGVLLLLLDWAKQAADRWFHLDFVDVTKVKSYGVFVIWKPGVAQVRSSVSIKVGHGDIASSLLKARHDLAVGKHGRDLLVTWAAVDVLYVAGVEAYLVQRLQPLIGLKLPLASMHPVNLPLVA